MGKILVSACLLGQNCKYNGGNNLSERVLTFVENKEIIPVCPEVAAGMPIPRPAVEIVDGVVVDVNGKNVDDIYRKGVLKVMQQIETESIEAAILQSRSPTCGVHHIYDGTFTKTLKHGKGLLAQALAEKEIHLIDVEDL